MLTVFVVEIMMCPLISLNVKFLSDLNGGWLFWWYQDFLLGQILVGLCVWLINGIISNSWFEFGYQFYSIFSTSNFLPSGFLRVLQSDIQVTGVQASCPPPWDSIQWFLDVLGTNKPLVDYSIVGLVFHWGKTELVAQKACKFCLQLTTAERVEGRWTWLFSFIFRDNEFI